MWQMLSKIRDDARDRYRVNAYWKIGCITRDIQLALITAKDAVRNFARNVLICLREMEILKQIGNGPKRTVFETTIAPHPDLNKQLSCGAAFLELRSLP
jgi:hypothetical protein